MADSSEFLNHKLHEAVQENEYDEFGMSKKKKFENLTRQEREAMDLQKVAQMESLLSSSVLKKITKREAIIRTKTLLV